MPETEQIQDLQTKHGDLILSEIVKDTLLWQPMAMDYATISSPLYPPKASWHNKVTQDTVDRAMTEGNYDVFGIVETIGTDLQKTALAVDVANALQHRMEHIRNGRQVGNTVTRALVTVLEEGVYVTENFGRSSDTKEALRSHFTDIRKLSIGDRFVTKVKEIQTMPELGGAVIFNTFPVGRMALTGLVDREGNPRVHMRVLANSKK